MRQMAGFWRRQVGSSRAAPPPSPLTIVTSTPPLFAFDPAIITPVSGFVQDWLDSGPAARHLTQATAASRPAFVASDAIFNGKPSVVWDGVDDALYNAAANFPWAAISGGFQPFFWFIATHDAWSGALPWFCTIAGGTGYVVFMNAVSPELTMFAGSSVNVNNGCTIGQGKRCEFSFTNSTSDYSQCGSTTVTGASAGAGSVSTNFFLGARNAAGAASSRLRLAYAACWLTKPTAGEIAALSSYAASYYGVGV